MLRLAGYSSGRSVCARGGSAGRFFLYTRRGVSAFLRKHFGFAMLSAGSTLGLKCGSRTAAAPDCAKESKVEAALRPLWTLFF